MEKKLIKPIILGLITCFIFYLIFSKIPVKKVIKAISNTNMLFLGFSILILIASVLLTIFRWNFITNSIKKVKFIDSAISIMASYPLNSLLPSKMGDFYKAYYFRQLGTTRVLGAVLTERIFDLFILVMLLFVASLLLKNSLFIGIAILVLSLLVIIVLIILFIPKITKKYKIFSKLSYSLRWMLKEINKSIILLAITLGVWLLSLLQIYFIFLSLSIHTQPTYFFASIIIIIFVGMIPITIAGMGTRETAIIYFFNAFATPEILLASGLMFSFFRYWFLSILGIPFLIKNKYIKTK